MPIVKPLEIQRLALNGELSRKPRHPHKPPPRPRIEPLVDSASSLAGGMGRHVFHPRKTQRAVGMRRPYPLVAGYSYPDPCSAPWYYPPGACTDLLSAQVADPLNGACCEGCASGSQCSGMGGLTELAGTAPMAASAAGAAAGWIYAVKHKKSIWGIVGYGIIGGAVGRAVGSLLGAALK